MFELFSIRNKPQTGEPEVFEYDTFPKTFRNQFLAIVNDALNVICHTYEFQNMWAIICEHFAREKGLKYLVSRSGHMNNSDAFEHYADTCNEEDFLDLMDFTFHIIDSEFIRDRVCSSNPNWVDNAVKELNHRLKQHSLGYEFCNGQIIKKTNTVTHETIVKPALKMLVDEQFRGAEEEYMNAWEHYTRGENKEAIMNAAKAFESTMKTICANKGYAFDKDRDEARKLLQILKKNGFFPSYLESHLNAVCTTLESGAPTVRNKTSGHGQGEERTVVPDNYVTYVLNLVATNIVFLCSLYGSNNDA